MDAIKNRLMESKSAQTALYSSAIAIPLLWTVWSYVIRSNAHGSYPPGPKRYPIVGNMPNFPKSQWYNAFIKWKEIYGDIIYAKILKTPVIIISSIEIAEELCAKRAHIWSGRPRSRMMMDLMGWDWNVVSIDPGPKHSAIRKIFKENLGSHVVHKHDPLIQKEMKKYIKSLHGHEGSPLEPTQAAVGAIVITIAYGRGVYEEHGAELTVLNRETLAQVTWMSRQLWLVEFIPILKYLPVWTPGAVFRRVGAEGRKRQERIHWWPWEEAKARLKAGTAGPSVATDYIEKGVDIQNTQDAVGMMFAAGVDTTSSTMVNFFYQMVQHPEIQRKVQAELDSVVGQSRLPVPSDRANLEYADAAWKESMRWHPTVAVSIPRKTLDEDVYNGMYLPKGALVLLNVGSMLSDPRIFSNPEKYQPERWIETYNSNAKDLPDVKNVAFGFGKRTCAGRFLAERVGFTLAMAVLSAYEVVPLPGSPLPRLEDTVFEDGTVTRPVGFKCAFKPRSNISKTLQLDD